MQHDAEELILKTRQYEFADGLRDIQLGFSFFIMGIFWYALALNPYIWALILRLEVDQWIRTIAFFLILVLPVFVILAFMPLMKWIRNRWVWRHTGTVIASRVAVPPQYTLLALFIFLSTVAFGIWLLPILQIGDFYIWSVILVAVGWRFCIIIGRREQVHQDKTLYGYWDYRCFGIPFNAIVPEFSTRSWIDISFWMGVVAAGQRNSGIIPGLASRQCVRTCRMRLEPSMTLIV